MTERWKSKGYSGENDGEKKLQSLLFYEKEVKSQKKKQISVLRDKGTPEGWSLPKEMIVNP